MKLAILSFHDVSYILYSMLYNSILFEFIEFAGLWLVDFFMLFLDEKILGPRNYFNLTTIGLHGMQNLASEDTIISESCDE